MFYEGFPVLQSQPKKIKICRLHNFYINKYLQWQSIKSLFSDDFGFLKASELLPSFAEQSTYHYFEILPETKLVDGSENPNYWSFTSYVLLFCLPLPASLSLTQKL